MAEIYNDKLKIQIGRVKASASADNYFPVANKDTIRIDAVTRWGQTTEWQIKDGSGSTLTSAGSLVKQKDSKQIAIVGGGELQQKFIARNFLTETKVVKAIYAMSAQTLPYFDVTAQEVTRVGDTGTILVGFRNGYAYSLSFSITARIYKENETGNPVRTLTFDVARPIPEGFIDGFTFTESSDRGIYDVEVDVTDTESGVKHTKRIDKLITIAPKLCPKPVDTSTGYETIISFMAEKQYTVHLWRNVEESGLNYAEWTAPHGAGEAASYDYVDISALPAGTTLCIKRENNESYPMRMRIGGNISVDVSSENGSPNFTYEKPLIITHDETEVFNWEWVSFGALSIVNNLRNVVIDGYGYNGKGIRFYPKEGASINTCIFITAGASDVEMFGIDIDGTGFAGVMAKTDPNVNQPWFWRGGFVLDNLRIHHCTIQNTAGEGVYLGYYGSGKLKGTNSKGEEVEYYAHLLDHLRLYRVDFINTGLDSFQVNNARNVDICYVNTTGSGASKQGGQNYASSSIFDGRMYNNKLLNCNGPVAFIGPLLGDLYIFNNIMESERYSGAFVFTLWKSSKDEHIDLDGDGVVDEINMYIHNNVIKGYSLGSFNSDYSFTKFFMDDNLIITEIGNDKIPAIFTGGEGNVFVKAAVNYEYIDQSLKVADSANDNYQPNYNSSLVASGKTGRSMYDIRGYKNWYNTVQRTGAYLGIYKDPDIIDTNLRLNDILINDGSAKTESQNVTVRFNYMGTPTRYRISESADLASIAWKTWTGSTIGFILSESYGDKTVYAQIATDDFESGVVSSFISYIHLEIIQFADAEVKRICVSKWGTDGEITSSEAASVTEIPDNTSYFRGNTLITSFDELVYFTGLTSIANNAFYGCTSLVSISFPESLKIIGQQSFRNCTSLANINFPAQMDEINIHAFWGCTALKILRLPDGIKTANCGYQSGIEELYIPNSVETVAQFTECINLRKVDIGTGVKSFLQNAFNADLAIEIFIIRALDIPSYAGWTLPDAFSGIIYVPDALVESYKTTAGWRNFSTKYKPLSEYVE